MKRITIDFGACSTSVPVTDRDAREHAEALRAHHEARDLFLATKRESQSFWSRRAKSAETKAELQRVEAKHLSKAYSKDAIDTPSEVARSTVCHFKTNHWTPTAG